MGGAANVAKNIRSLGAKCILCSVIGDDINGEEFNKLIEKNRIVGDALVISSDRKTTVKHRVLSGSQQLLRLMIYMFYLNIMLLQSSKKMLGII